MLPRQRHIDRLVDRDELGCGISQLPWESMFVMVMNFKYDIFKARIAFQPFLIGCMPRLEALIWPLIPSSEI